MRLYDSAPHPPTSPPPLFRQQLISLPINSLSHSIPSDFKARWQFVGGRGVTKNIMKQNPSDTVTQYLMYSCIESTTVYVPSSELGLSHPVSRQRVCPSPEPKGGGHTRPLARGWGSPNSDDWRDSLALCLFCGYGHFFLFLEGMVAAPWLKAATTSSRNGSTGYDEDGGPRYCGEKECGIECPADRWCANTGSCDVVDSI